MDLQPVLGDSRAFNHNALLHGHLKITRRHTLFCEGRNSLDCVAGPRCFLSELQGEPSGFLSCHLARLPKTPSSREPARPPLFCLLLAESPWPSLLDIWARPLSIGVFSIFPTSIKIKDYIWRCINFVW